MAWTGVITDVGKALIAQYIAGSVAINVNRLEVGSGSTDDMEGATALTTFKDTGTMVKKTEVTGGVDFKFQISACENSAYTAKEIGMFANYENGSGTLLALFQNETGVSIPARATNPDFAYILSAVLAIDNLDSLTITVDSTAFVTNAVCDERYNGLLALLATKVDKVAGKGLTEAEFTTAEKAKLAGIEAEANKYVLPTASASTLGGVKVGAGLDISSGKLRNAGVRSVSQGSANGTLAVNTDGSSTDVPVKGLKTAAYREADSFANSTHTHSATDITSGVLPIARGGTGLNDYPTMLVKLNETEADNVFKANPRPGVTGKLQISNGGTGADTASGARANLGAAAMSHNHNASDINAGTLPVARGGTGIGSNPSMTVNLQSTSADNVFKASPSPGVSGKLPIANGGTGANTASGARANLGVAAASHNHNASDINEGTLAVARGGTGVSANPSMLVDLSKTTADTVFKSSPAPGVKNTLGVANGGTGINANPSMRVNLGSTSADNVFKNNPSPGVSGQLPVANGGTGASSASGARTNLGAAALNHTHSMDDITSGTLPVSKGGTGASSASGARTNLDAAARVHTHSMSDISDIPSLPDGIGTFVGDGVGSEYGTGTSPGKRKITVGFTPSRVVLMCIPTKKAFINTLMSSGVQQSSNESSIISFATGENYVSVYADNKYVTATTTALINEYFALGRGGAAITSNGFYVADSHDLITNTTMINVDGWFYMWFAWR